MAATRFIESLTGLLAKTSGAPELAPLVGSAEETLEKRRETAINRILINLGQHPIWTALIYGAISEQDPTYFDSEGNLRDFIETVASKAQAFFLLIGPATHKKAEGYLTMNIQPYGWPVGGRLGFISAEHYTEWHGHKAMRNTNQFPPPYLQDRERHFQPEWEMKGDPQLFESLLLGLAENLEVASHHVPEMIVRLEKFGHMHGNLMSFNSEFTAAVRNFFLAKDGD